MAAACLAALLALPVAGGEATLRLTATPEHSPTEAPAGAGMVIPAGMVAVYGRIAGPDFAVAQLEQVAVATAAGEPVPMLVDDASKFVEFDEIVGFWCCLLLPADQAEPGTILTLRWGEDVAGKTTPVEALRFAMEDLGRVRGFRVEAGPANSGDQAAMTSVRVIADSTADYHFLWYLLPMGALFTLLTIRRLRGDVGAD